MDVREKQTVASHTRPYLGSNLQPRHVSWPWVKPSARDNIPTMSHASQVFFIALYSACHLGTARALPMGIHYLITENTWKSSSAITVRNNTQPSFTGGCICRLWQSLDLPGGRKIVSKDDYSLTNKSSCKLVIILEELKIKEINFKTWHLQILFSFDFNSIHDSLWLHYPVTFFLPDWNCSILDQKMKDAPLKVKPLKIPT